MGGFKMVKLVVKRSGSAFLLELCIAMFIIGIGCMLMMRSSVNGYGGIVDGKGRLAATFSAKEKMRELRIAPYTPDGTDKDTVNQVPCVRTWSATDVNSIRKISVSVSYKVRSGDRTVTLTGAMK